MEHPEDDELRSKESRASAYAARTPPAVASRGPEVLQHGRHGETRPVHAFRGEDNHSNTPVPPFPPPSAGDILHLLFRLKHQKLIEDYSCAVSEQVLLHGRMVRRSDIAREGASSFPPPPTPSPPPHAPLPPFPRST